MNVPCNVYEYYMSKSLSLGKTQINLVFRSHIRNFATKKRTYENFSVSAPGARLVMGNCQRFSFA